MRGIKSEAPKRGFLWNSSVYLIATGFSVVVSLLVLPVYTRFLSPADYGIVVLYIMFGNLIVGILSINLHFSSYMYFFQFKNDLARFKSIYSTNALFLVLVFAVSGLLVHLVSGWVSSSIFQERLPAGLILLSFVSGCLEYGILYMTTLLTAQVRSIHYAAIIISRLVINVSLAFYFIFAHSLTYLALIYSLLLSQALTLVVLAVANRNLFGLRISMADLVMSLKLGFPLVPTSMVGLLYSSFDKTMLNKYKNTDSVGYYSFGEKFALLLKMVQDGISKSWDPYFMNAAHENSAGAREAIIKRFYEIAFLFMIIGLCIVYYSEELIKLLTTAAYYPSMYVVPLYVYFYLFAIIATLAMNQISFSKKMAYLFPISLAGAIINVLLNLTLIPKYGAVGAAGALAISALSTNCIMLFFGMKLYPLPLGLGRLTFMYLLLIAFTLPVYPIMQMDMAAMLKIVLKLILILSFVAVGVKLQYISKSNIQHIIAKIKGATMNLVGAA